MSSHINLKYYLNIILCIICTQSVKVGIILFFIYFFTVFFVKLGYVKLICNDRDNQRWTSRAWAGQDPKIKYHRFLLRADTVIFSSVHYWQKTCNLFLECGTEESLVTAGGMLQDELDRSVKGVSHKNDTQLRSRAHSHDISNTDSSTPCHTCRARQLSQIRLSQNLPRQAINPLTQPQPVYIAHSACLKDRDLRISKFWCWCVLDFFHYSHRSETDRCNGWKNVKNSY